MRPPSRQYLQVNTEERDRDERTAKSERNRHCTVKAGNALLRYLGFSAAYRNEEAFRQELLACLVLLPLGLLAWRYQRRTRLCLPAVLSCLLIVELLNTAVEVVVNRIGLDRHELSGLAKDLGSAAVSMAIINAAVIWLLVLFT